MIGKVPSPVGLQIEKLDARRGPGLPSGDLARTAVAESGLRLLPSFLVCAWQACLSMEIVLVLVLTIPCASFSSPQ